MSGAVGRYEMDELRLVVGAMVILSGATALLVAVPYLLLKDTPPPAGLKPYTAVQLEGRQSYIANGCVYCHSQQPRDSAQAPDALRGWGRASVAGDYAYDTPHLLGTMRTGPDLLNIGARQPSRDWHLGHLYAPRAYTPGSIMPAYPYLFDVRSGRGPAGRGGGQPAAGLGQARPGGGGQTRGAGPGRVPDLAGPHLPGTAAPATAATACSGCGRGYKRRPLMDGPPLSRKRELDDSATRRELADPDERVRPLPWFFTMFLGAMGMWGAFYITATPSGEASAYGDQRTVADLRPAVVAPGAAAGIDGKQLFGAKCAACHQASGLGVAGRVSAAGRVGMGGRLGEGADQPAAAWRGRRTGRQGQHLQGRDAGLWQPERWRDWQRC